MKKTRIIQGVAGVVLAGIGLYIFFLQAGSGTESLFAVLMREIASMSASTISACAVLSVLAVWLRAVRLSIILPDNGQHQQDQQCSSPNKRGIFSVVMVSFMMNNILPARLGEAARVILVWKRNKFTIAASVGSLLVERVLDIIVYLTFLVVPVLFLSEISANLRSISPVAIPAVWAFAALLVLLIGISALYAMSPLIFRRAASRLGLLLPKKIRALVRKHGAEAETCVDWIFLPRKAIIITSLSFAVGICYATMLAVLISEFSASGFLKSIFGQAFAALGSAIPLAPGYVGTLHVILQQGLTIAGLESGRAGAVVVLYHAVQYVVITGIGLLFLAGMNIRLKDITEEPPPPPSS